MDFLQSTYEAGANLAKWDRASLRVDKMEVEAAVRVITSSQIAVG